MDSCSSYDVVVVGAGLSGLAAARQLTKSAPGLRICILEARDRVGGRTESLPHIGVDVGAQWIGPTHTEMIKLCEEFDLKFIEQDYPVFEYCKGNRLVECVGYPGDELGPDDIRMVDEYTKLLNELMEQIDIRCPWEHPQAKQWDEISLASHICSKVKSTKAQFELKLFAQTVLACDPENISFLCFLYYIKSGGGIEALGDGEQGAQRWRVKGGMQQVSQRLYEELLEKGVHVKLNFAVGTCKLSNDGMIILEKAKSQEKVSGDVIHANKAVWALSPVVLARIQFESSIIQKYPMMQKKLDLGQRMLPGYAAKVIVAFKTAFWLKGKFSESPLAHFAELGYVHNLFHSELSDGTPALVGLVTGNAAVKFAKMNEDDRKSTVLKQLKSMYLQNPQDILPEIVLYHDKVWSDEEYSGGCFAGIFPASGVLHEHGAILRAASGPFHFCSTETNSEFYGYMEGAVRSGYRAGQECALSLEASLIG